MNDLNSIKTSNFLHLYSTAHNLANSTIHWLGSLDEKFKPINLVNKIIIVSTSIFTSYTKIENELINNIVSCSKESKKYFNLLKGLKSVNNIIYPKESEPCLRRTIKILNYSGLILLGFTLIEFAEKLQIANFSSVHRFCQKVPVFGVLTFAGIPKLASLSLFACLAIKGMVQGAKFHKDKKNFEAKQLFWNGVADSLENNSHYDLNKLINERSEAHSKKHALRTGPSPKPSFFNEFENLNLETKKSLVAAKQNKWERYVINNEWKTLENRYSTVQRVVNIASLILITTLILCPPTTAAIATGCTIATITLSVIDLTLAIAAMRAKYHVVSYETIKQSF